MSGFKNEWAMLHHDIERYERFSLIIKLCAVFASVLAVGFATSWWFALSLVLVLWLQDAIWKTFQQRSEARILILEQHIKNDSTESSKTFQFYSEWQNTRQGVVGLIKEYLFSAIKPTVAFPYAVLLVLLVAYYFYSGILF